MITLTPVQTIALLVGTFPTNGSEGKLLVKNNVGDLACFELK